MHATDRQKRQAWCSPGGADSQLGSIGHWSSMLSCAPLCSRVRQSTRRRREDGMAGLPWNREMINFGNILLAMESRESVAALERLAVFVYVFYSICCKLTGWIRWTVRSSPCPCLSTCDLQDLEDIPVTHTPQYWPKEAGRIAHFEGDDAILDYWISEGCVVPVLQ